MDISVQKGERPPYVQFERREIENRGESVTAGKYCAKNVDFVLITPQGSRDCVEREVTVWFPYLTEQVKQGRVPPQWLEGWKFAYDQWQKGQEIPLNGTPIRTWTALTPSQAKLLISINILTVEDLAAANDEAIQRIGMGANELKRRAEDFLKQANGPGKLVAEISAMRAELADVTTRNKTLEALNAELMARLNQFAPPPTAVPVVPPSRQDDEKDEIQL